MIYLRGMSSPQPEHRQLGASGPVVFPLALGCMGMSDLYGPADEAESIATIDAALDAGITLLDTGDYYAAGHNELLIGRCLAGSSRQGLDLGEVRRRAWPGRSLPNRLVHSTSSCQRQTSCVSRRPCHRQPWPARATTNIRCASWTASAKRGDRTRYQPPHRGIYEENCRSPGSRMPFGKPSHNRGVRPVRLGRRHWH